MTLEGVGWVSLDHKFRHAEGVACNYVATSAAKNYFCLGNSKQELIKEAISDFLN